MAVVTRKNICEFVKILGSDDVNAA